MAIVPSVEVGEEPLDLERAVRGGCRERRVDRDGFGSIGPGIGVVGDVGATEEPEFLVHGSPAPLTWVEFAVPREFAFDEAVRDAEGVAGAAH